MTTSAEQMIDIEAVRTSYIRDNYGVLSGLGALGASIRDEGMRHPITLWRDGTLISGHRRHRACLMLGRRGIQAVFVDTIEDAAKAILTDAEDDYLALPLTWTQVCRIWGVLRRLDLPAAAERAEAARRQGVELRRQTLTGKRKPGRTGSHSEDYVLSVLAPPFGVSESTAKRLWAIYRFAYGLTDVTEEKRTRALAALRDIDLGESSISANYERLVRDRVAPVSRPRTPAKTAESAAADRQQAAWDRALPQLEGIVAGLMELGPANPELTWQQVGPVHTRLSAVRRDLEKMIKQMRGTNQS